MALRPSAGLGSRAISSCSCMRLTWWESRLFSHCNRPHRSCAGMRPALVQPAGPGRCQSQAVTLTSRTVRFCSAVSACPGTRLCR